MKAFEGSEDEERKTARRNLAGRKSVRVGGGDGVRGGEDTSQIGGSKNIVEIQARGGQKWVFWLEGWENVIKAVYRRGYETLGKRVTPEVAVRED